MCRKDEECVEPASSLIYRFGDKVCRERAFELLLVLERIMDLCVWHASGLEPTIKDFLDSAKDAFTLLGGDGDVINLVSVQIGDGIDSRQLSQLVNRSDANDLESE